jgi:2-keto-3-deoxy-L-rhamnonate aldolase RhmA
MGSPLNQRLAAGEVLFGAVLNMASPALVEICCGAGADFLFLDFEHGLHDFSEIANAIITADLCGTPALVRVGERSPNLVARMLDAGAAGLIFPHVQNAAEAAELVSWCRYKPQGQRGSGLARGFLRYAGSEFDRRMQANRDVTCLMIVEDQEGMANLGEIAAVNGVTGIGIGPGDLSMAMGAASWDDERVTTALDEMTRSARRQPGCAVMRLALDQAAVAELVKLGVNMVLATHDAHLIKDMYRNLFKGFRDGAMSSDGRAKH